MQERWFVSNDPDERTFAEKLGSENRARILFPKENVEQRYARVCSRNYQYACPNCGSVKLSITVPVSVRLFQDRDGNIETEYDGGDHEWGDNSETRCDTCTHVGVVSGFALGGE